jgi:phage terminase large subunit-like protein
VSIAPWPPARYSAPLAESHPSLYERYADVLDLAWQAATGYRLDGWQTALLHAVTETFPAGHERAGQLRFRQALATLGRQNGKSEVTAALGLLTMLARPYGLVVGIASTAEQSRIIYKRVMQVILGNAALRNRFERMTETRGLESTNGARWEIKASKSAALQGLAVDLAIVDEVHLVKRELWTDLLAGTGGRPDTLVAGISTAGDDNSELLKALYERIEAGDDERFGYWIWEAPEARAPSDDAELLRYLRCANPALAAGRLDADNVLSDVRAMPTHDAIRYRLNRFVSATSAFISLEAWRGCAASGDATFPAGCRPTFAVDRTPDWGHACVTVAAVDEAGMLHTEVVASLAQPDLDRLEALCLALAAHQPATFAVDGYALKELGTRLKRRGLPVQVLSQGDIVSASSLFYAKIMQRKLSHAGDPLLTAQIPRTSRRNTGTGFRITRADSASQIDAVMSTVMSVYVAETATAAAPQLFT